MVEILSVRDTIIRKIKEVSLVMMYLNIRIKKRRDKNNVKFEILLLKQNE